MKNKSQYYFLVLHENFSYFRVDSLGGKATRRVQISLKPEYWVKTLASSEQGAFHKFRKSLEKSGSSLHFSSRLSKLAVKLSLRHMGSLNCLDFLHSHRHCQEKATLSFQSSLSVCCSCNSRENVSRRIKARL